MARFRRSFRRRSSSSRSTRQKTWEDWETFTAGTSNRRPFTLTAGGTSTSWILPPNECIAEHDEPTVVRLLIRYWSVPVPTVFASGAYEFDHQMGIIVVRGEIGATPGDLNGVPTVATERGDQDWLWYDIQHYSRFSAGGAEPWLGPGSYTIPAAPVIDVRAKRKIPTGFGLLYCNKLTADSFGGSVVGWTAGRMLLIDH